jgi:hypothetical protein
MNSRVLMQDLYTSILQITYDGKLAYASNTNQNNQFDCYLTKLNKDLEDDTLYTFPFTYDSLCPFQIVSDTIVQDDCGLIVGIEEPGGGEAWEQGSGEAGRQGGLEVWPNPASGVLSVKCLGLSSGSSCSLAVVDIFGRQVISLLRQPAERAGDGGWQIDVSTLPAGIFVAVLRDEQTIIGTTKFVVAR